MEASAFAEDARRAQADARVADAPTAEQAEARVIGRVRVRLGLG